MPRITDAKAPVRVELSVFINYDLHSPFSAYRVEPFFCSGSRTVGDGDAGYGGEFVREPAELKEILLGD